jgi:hypothetical protein
MAEKYFPRQSAKGRLTVPEALLIDRFDASDDLTDESVRERIVILLSALREWIQRVRSGLDR